jgi:hypothetical protein
MGNTWISNIRHFLDDDGEIPYDLPGPAYQLASYFGSIVEAVTSRGKIKMYETGIRCRRRPSRKRCHGEVLALIDGKSNFEIKWECPVCNDNGIISGWQGTLWDKSKKS